MRKVIYMMSMSLDGYIVDPDGGIDWSVPDPAIFQFFTDETRDLGAHLMGTRLYETMLYWETVDPATLDDADRDWVAVWNPLPKIVFSHSLTDLVGNARLATEGVGEEIARLRAEPGDGGIAIGGADLAAQVAALDLIDEYQVIVYPVLLGGGRPYFVHDNRLVNLKLVETRTFDSGAVYLHYVVEH